MVYGGVIPFEKYYIVNLDQFPYNRDEISQKTKFDKSPPTSFFQVTFWSSKWRSLNPWKGHLKLKTPKHVTNGRTWHLVLKFIVLMGVSPLVVTFQI